MKKSFYASACINGLHGGAVYLVDNGFRFCCQKITIVNEYKNLQIPYKKIKLVSVGKRVLFIPTTIIETVDGGIYRFLIFNRKEFVRCIAKFVEQSV